MQTVINDVVTYGPIVITAAAAAAAVLPKGEAGSTWATIRAVIEALALNFGNAKAAPKQ